MITDYDKHVVIDLGSSSIKAGFCGDDGPKCVFPSIIGHAKYKGVLSNEKIETYVGYQAQNSRGILSIQYPIQNGTVTDWNSMEKLLDNAFSNELRIESKEHTILFTDPLYNTTENREKMLQLIFETFDVSKAIFANQQMLSVFGSGKVTSIGFDCGEGRACSVPIYDGNILKDSIEILEVGGSHLTEYLGRILQESGRSFSSTAEREIVKDIKEKLCFVALDFENEESTVKSNHNLEKPYELPDGNFIYVSDVRFRCPEVLFQPEVIGVKKNGIHHVINDSINKINSEIRNEFYKNINLCGGSTMFQGIEHRLAKEIKTLSSVSTKITAMPERKYLPWIGGSIFSSISTAQDLFITQKEYHDCGVSILNKIEHILV